MTESNEDLIAEIQQHSLNHDFRPLGVTLRELQDRVNFAVTRRTDIPRENMSRVQLYAVGLIESHSIHKMFPPNNPARSQNTTLLAIIRDDSLLEFLHFNRGVTDPAFLDKINDMTHFAVTGTSATSMAIAREDMSRVQLFAIGLLEAFSKLLICDQNSRKIPDIRKIHNESCTNVIKDSIMQQIRLT